MKSNITRFENEADIIRHSNVVLSEGLLPTRFVLRDLGDQFVTHMELMVITAQARADDTIELTCSHLAYESGHYFRFRPEGHEGFSNYPTREQALEEAKLDWQNRVAKHSLR